MVKIKMKTSNLIEIIKLKNIGVPIKDQYKLMNLEEMDPIIKQMIMNIINQYGDVRTILTLQELLNSSNASRAKTIPRPQNAWVLFRRNISKGLNMSVSDTSEIVSYMWNNKSIREHEFWKALYYITKKIHFIKYPNYKYNPGTRNKKFNEWQSTENNSSILKEYLEIETNLKSNSNSTVEITNMKRNYGEIEEFKHMVDLKFKDMNGKFDVLISKLDDEFYEFKKSFNEFQINADNNFLKLHDSFKKINKIHEMTVTSVINNNDRNISNYSETKVRRSNRITNNKYGSMNS
jgi:hypothetical protein